MGQQVKDDREIKKVEMGSKKASEFLKQTFIPTPGEIKFCLVYNTAALIFLSHRTDSKTN